MNIQNLIYPLPGIIIGLTVHEYFHAFAASKLGDHTAREMGRLSFNPLKHVDIIGFIFIILAGFGWAKPVRFNAENLSHPRRDKAIIAAAGPVSNFLLALVFAALIKAWEALSPYITSSPGGILAFLHSDPFLILMHAIYYAMMINLGLFIFNLIPIPPLDGSRIVFSGLNLNPETEATIMKIGAPLLILLFVVQNRTGITILPIGKLVFSLMNFILN